MVVNECSKSSGIRKAMFKDIRHVLSQRDSLKQRALTIRRLSTLFFMKDSFRISMTLMAHFDLELHQMDIKTVFLNGDIEEEIYMVQPNIFEAKGS